MTKKNNKDVFTDRTPGERLAFLTSKEKRSHYDLAREIEKANFAEPQDEEEEEEVK